MVHNAYSGKFYTVDQKGKQIVAVIDVALNITVVNDIKDAKSTDYILTLVDKIPDQVTSEGFTKNIVGLAENNGNVGMVDRRGPGTYVNEVLKHELGHIFGLGHTPGTIMNASIDTDPNNRFLFANAAQIRQLWEGIANMNSGTYRGRYAAPGDSRQQMQDFINKND
jgi:hypothetical protein